MEQIGAEAVRKPGVTRNDSLIQRRYVLPFLLACVILFCNTATGINSVIGYNTDILLQSGLSDVLAHWGYVVFTAVNFLMTIVGLTLVDLKGRKFLFTVGTSGIIISMLSVGALFVRSERFRTDWRGAVQPVVTANQTLDLNPNRTDFWKVSGQDVPATQVRSLAIIYSYGDFSGSTTPVRSNDPAAPTIEIHRSDAVPS